MPTDKEIPGRITLTLGEALARFDREAVRGVCETGHYRCPYYTWGQGPPLLLIPGLSDDALSFVMLVALLAGNFRCIAYNLPTGRGDGARLARYTHGDLVEDALALLDHLGASQSYVMGASFGSTIALAAMHRRPRTFPRGILHGGFARRRLAFMEVLLAACARFWPGRQGSLPFRPALLRRVHHPPFEGRDQDVWDFFLTCWGLPWLSATGYRALMLHHLDLRPLLPHNRQPVLLVCGDSDPLVNRACENQLMQGLPNVGRVGLAGCGHNPLFTHPEALAEVVRGFFTPPVCPLGPVHCKL
jgi:pimeloyl-ACP methyl ester carboxylesterase